MSLRRREPFVHCGENILDPLQDFGYRVTTSERGLRRREMSLAAIVSLQQGADDVHSVVGVHRTASSAPGDGSAPHPIGRKKHPVGVRRQAAEVRKAQGPLRKEDLTMNRIVTAAALALTIGMSVAPAFAQTYDEVVAADKAANFAAASAYKATHKPVDDIQTKLKAEFAYGNARNAYNATHNVPNSGYDDIKARPEADDRMVTEDSKASGR